MMDQRTVFTKIKELGGIPSKRDELKELCLQHFNQITKQLPHRLISSDGGHLLGCILNGLRENSDSCKEKVQIIELVLCTMRKESTSLAHCGDVSSRLCLELPRLPLDSLVKWSNDSIQSIVNDKDVNMIWRDVLPECINAISSQDKVKHCGTEMSSSDYKAQCVATLCQCSWKERQLVQLTAMFKDMQLSPNDHKQVVNKICSYIIDTPPDTLPPLLHQLLKLCKTSNLEIVLSHLSHYFTVRLYSTLEPPPNDSESTTVDIDDIVPHSAAELSRCLSTCIYHTTQGAVDSELVRKHLRTWPKTQLLRSPFLIDLALAMSEKGSDFRSTCLEIIRSAIEQRMLDDLRAQEAAWVKSVMGRDVDISMLFKTLTTESANHRELTVPGLIHLAFILLFTSRVKAISRTCWSLGELILVRLSKTQPECAPHVLTQLADKLVASTENKQYANCLYILCKSTPASVERCTELSLILENCRPTPTEFRSAASVLEAVRPLLNFSTRCRDTLVMVCRKGLYSRDSQHRCLALWGLLSVLRHVRVSVSSAPAYSDVFSAHSYLTQAAVDLHATQQGNTVTSRVRNEAMCMEVVSILRRCLLQDASVKQLLYTNIYECVKDKQSLHESILESLYEHLNKYLDADNTQLAMDKCVQVTATSAVLNEPIATLLYAISQFLQPCDADEDLEDILSSQSVETGSAYLKSKLGIVIDKLCSCENIGNIDMQEHGLSDMTIESKVKCLKVQQVLQCYETLIAYQIMQWNRNSTNSAQKVVQLYKKCFELTEQSKSPSKNSKKANKTLNETKDTNKSTQRSQKSQKSQKQKGKAPVKLSNLVKDKAGPFKQLACVWDLKFCVKVLELLYSEDVSWSSVEQRVHLRGRRDFHHWALNCIHSVMAETKDKKYLATHGVAIANILYKRCVCRFQNMCDFDDLTTLKCLELFKTCLTLLFSTEYSLNMDAFLSTITETTETSPPCKIAAILESTLSALQHIENECASEEGDQQVKRNHAALIQIAGFLLEVPAPTSDNMTRIISKFEDYIRMSKQDCLQLIGPLLTAGTRDQQENTMLTELLQKLITTLGQIDEDDSIVQTQETIDYSSIGVRTGQTVVGTVCSYLAQRGKSIEHLLNRAKDLTAAVALPAHHGVQRLQREVDEVYKSLIIQLCQLTSWTSSCLTLRCSVGVTSELVLRAARRLYSLLTTLVRQVPVTIAREHRFERLVKLSGRKLYTVTIGFLGYLEEAQKEQNTAKVLKETKTIPSLFKEAENYSRRAMELSNKANLNWGNYFSFGAARDFRIKVPLLEQALNAREPEVIIEEEETVDINDASIIRHHSDEEVEDEDENEEDSTRNKRRRVS